jgi:hypothetical protein
VDNVSRVAVVDCGEDLFYDVGGISFTKVLLICNALEQFAAVAESKVKVRRMRANYSVTKK